MEAKIHRAEAELKLLEEKSISTEYLNDQQKLTQLTHGGKTVAH